MSKKRIMAFMLFLALLGSSTRVLHTEAKAEETNMIPGYTWMQPLPDSGVLLNKTYNSERSINDADSYSRFILPEMFGAVGDGITDDSAAIELAATKGPLYCGDKEYYIKNTITVYNSIVGGRFHLQKDATIKIQKDNCTLENCEFYRDELPSDAEDRGRWAVIVSNSKKATITNCYFHDLVSCLYLDRCNDAAVSYNLFENCPQTAKGGNGYGVLLIESNRVTISNNSFINVARHSIYLSNDNSAYNTNILISDNTFEWNENITGNRTGFESTIEIRPSKNIRIVGNYFNNMFTMCTVSRQPITVDEKTIVSSTSELYILNNIGFFDQRYRRDGVIFFSGSSYEEFPSAEHIIIKGNIIDTNTHFVRADYFDDLRIENNDITLRGESTALVYVEEKFSDMIQDLSIADNTIDLNEGTLFKINKQAKNTSRNHLGNLIIQNNYVEDLESILSLSGEDYSFNTVSCINNFLIYCMNAKENESRISAKKIYSNGNYSYKSKK